MDRAAPVTGRPKPPTIKDVARLAGVGIGTVSRYLNATGPVSAEAASRVGEAIARLDYRTNVNAAALRGKSSRILGVLVPDLENPAISPIVKAIERLARAAGYSLIVTSGDRSFAIEAEAIATLVSRGVAGLILIPTTQDGTELAAAIGDDDIPLVLMDRDFALPRGRAGRVLVAHDAGLRQATRHLVERGHRQLLLLHAEDNRAAQNRVKGFTEGMAGAEGVCGAALACARSATAARDLVTAALASDTPPDAIIAGHNRMLSGVLSALKARGLSAGRDISVVTCDQTELAELHDPAIAWIDRHSEQIGTAAFRVFEALGKRAKSEAAAEVTVDVETVFHPADSICDRRG